MKRSSDFCHSNVLRTGAERVKDFPLPSERDVAFTGGTMNDEKSSGHYNSKLVQNVWFEIQWLRLVAGGKYTLQLEFSLKIVSPNISDRPLHFFSLFHRLYLMTVLLGFVGLSVAKILPINYSTTKKNETPTSFILQQAHEKLWSKPIHSLYEVQNAARRANKITFAAASSNTPHSYATQTSVLFPRTTSFPSPA